MKNQLEPVKEINNLEARRNEIIFCEFRQLACRCGNDWSDRMFRKPRLIPPYKKRQITELLKTPNMKVTVNEIEHGLVISSGHWRLAVPNNPKEEFTLSLRFQRTTTFGKYSVTVKENIFAPENVKKYVITYYGKEAYQEFRRKVMSTFEESLKQIMAKLQKLYPQLQRKSLTCSEVSERLLAKIPGIKIDDHYAVIEFQNTELQ